MKPLFLIMLFLMWFVGAVSQETTGFDTVAEDLPLGAGELKSSISKYWKAKQLLDSIDLCQAEGLQERVPDLKIRLASLLRASGNLPESYSMLHELLVTDHDLSEQQLGRIYLILANVFYELNIHLEERKGLIDSVLFYTQKVKALALHLQDIQLQVDALNLEGGINIQREELGKAEANLRQALLQSANVTPGTRMAILANLSLVLLHQHKYHDALLYSDSCERLAIAENSNIFRIMALQNKELIYSQMGDTHAARSVHDTISDFEGNKVIVLEALMVKKLLIDHQFREAGKQVADLGLKNILLQQHNRYLWIILLIIVLSVMIIAILLTMVYRKNKLVSIHRQLIKDREVDLGRARVEILEREHTLQKHKAEQLKLELDAREQEMVNHTLREAYVKQLNTTLHDKMTPFLTRLTRKKDREEFSLALSELYVKSQRDPLKDFEQKFTSIHGHFYERLIELSSDLTPVELQMSALLRTNLASKDIAGLMKLSVSRVDQIRHQIRTKLNLDQSQNLVTFLHGL